MSPRGPRRVYAQTCIALLVLTFLTWTIARIDLGRWNLAIAMGIAVSKASLVVLFFMHLRGGARRIQVVALAGLLWLAILLSLTMTDYMSRS